MAYSKNAHISLPPFCIINTTYTNLIVIISCCQSHIGIGDIALPCHGEKFILQIFGFLGLP